MTLLQLLLLFGCLVLSFFFLAEAVVNFLKSRSDKAARLLKQQPVVAAEIVPSERSIKRIEINPNDFFIDRYLKGLLASVDIPLSLKRLYLVIAAIAVLLTAVFYIYLPYVPLIVSFFLSAMLGFFVPVILLKRQCQTRNDHFKELFPDALELIVRSLRVGQPLNASIRAVADEMPDPVGKEFYIISQGIAYGKDLPTAVEDILQRISIQDLKFFVVAVQVQSESGGNLAEVLEGFSKIIRARARLERKVQALTAEGRFSAWFLSIFPLFMIFVMSVVNTDYYKSVSDFAYFKELSMTVGFMLVVNIIAMQMITKIEV
jgi:tight adherence protein B